MKIFISFWFLSVHNTPVAKAAKKKKNQYHVKNELL
jgi:hypothetical protein